MPDADLSAQRAVIDAFQAAAREGDFDALVAVLDPDVVLRADSSGLPTGGPVEIRGAAAVASRAQSYARLALDQHPVIVNGAAGMLALRDGRPFALMGIIVRDGRIAEMDIIADAERLASLRLEALGR